ncbi:MAG: DUF4157 domain-containing protein [Oscillospiraceae bacterium]
MSKKLLENIGAEHEANEIASRFMDSTDVVGDMSRAFGHDFSQVHIHTDESAAQRVEGTGADAFAQGNDTFLRPGRDFGRAIIASRGLWPTSRPTPCSNPEKAAFTRARRRARCRAVSLTGSAKSSAKRSSR